MRLQCVAGPYKGKSWTLESTATTIGRGEECDIVLDDVKISRVHAELVFEGSDLIFRDNDSTNGSKINDALAETQVLSLGDRLTLGSVQLVLFDDEEPADFDSDQTRASSIPPPQP